MVLQYPDYIDAYLRLAAIAKARNDIQLSIALVRDELYIFFKDFTNLVGLCHDTDVSLTSDRGCS